MTLFDLKNEILSKYASAVAPMDFYRDMFPVGSFEQRGQQQQHKANGILCSIKNGQGRHTIVFDDLKEIEDHLDDDFVVISPVAYFGRRRSAYNASLLYGFCFDVDDVGEEELTWILERLENTHFPRATYIANSGNGLHMYYLFSHPVLLYKSIHAKLNDFKHTLTEFIWNKYTSKIPPENRQYQGIFQGFRMVGSKSKSGNGRITVFKTGPKVDIEFFNKFLEKKNQLKNINYETSLTLEKAKEKYPEWYERRIIRHEEKNRWHVKRALYDWWFSKIQVDEDLSVGHRYFCIAVLASYAAKCDIAENELRHDAYSLKNFMNTLKKDFSDDDIESALNFYQESFIHFPRSEVERISGLKVPANKRNRRPQKLHLKIARATRDILHENWQNKNGAPKKKEIVLRWKKFNPGGRKFDCYRETGLSRVTIDRWWNCDEEKELRQ